MTAESPTEATQREKIHFEEVTKQFGRVTAVDHLSLSIRENEILALVGDNGAGKSTLMNILTGVHQPTSGRVYFEGERVAFDNPSDARAHGIEMVYQHLALMNDLDVATNVFMGKFPTFVDAGPLGIIDWNETYERTSEMLSFLNQDIDPETEVAFLSGGQRQLVAIARSLSFDPEVIVLDEPTSALSIAGTELVHENIRQLKGEGHTQVLISHSIDDVFDLADRIAVMHQGRLVDTVRPGETTKETVAGMMVTGVTDD